MSYTETIEERGDDYEKEDVEKEDNDQRGNHDDNVLLNMNPKKFDQPKDHLFFDFFSLYTKDFIHDDNKPKKQATKANRGNSVA